MARSKRSAEKEQFWRSMVEEHGQGGLNVRAFCRQKGISEPSFYAWRKELQKRDAEQAVGAGNGADTESVAAVLPSGEPPGGHFRSLHDPIEAHGESGERGSSPRPSW